VAAAGVGRLRRIPSFLVFEASPCAAGA